jgi:Methyltransferase domain
MILQAPFRDRNRFGEFLNSLGLHGIGVEIGTDRAGFAVELLEIWRCEKFFCVDPWITGYDLPDDPPNRKTQAERDEDERIAREALSRFPNALVLKMTSMEAAKTFHSDTLDFVYIDGNHNQDHVKRDLIEWFINLRSGGVLAGHDFIVPTSKRISGEIQDALMSFSRPVFSTTDKGIDRSELDIYLVPETALDQPWSWYLFKR